MAYWRTLPTDEGATYDRTLVIDAAELEPYVTWGTNPAQSVTVGEAVPDPDSFADPAQGDSARQALAYMALEPGTPIEDIAIDRVFIGSCTNSRISDLRIAASVVEGRRVAPTVQAMVVPGSMRRSRRRPRPRAWTASSRTPGWSGATPAARCAWA